MTAPVDRDSYLQGKERAARDSLIQLPRRTKQLIMLVTDALGFIACVALCGWIQLIDPIVRADGLFVTFASLVLAHVLARYLGFYHSIVRYLGMGLLMAGARVAVGSAVALAALAWWAGITTQPFRLAVVYAAFCGLYLVGSRYFAQYFLVRRAPDKSNVIVYGAGESGARVAQAMHGNNTFKPVAFVDDDPSLHGKQLFGLPIRSRHELEHLISKYD
jgi:FlaA1/EpsC-like NDP-sugar epimerase